MLRQSPLSYRIISWEKEAVIAAFSTRLLNYDLRFAKTNSGIKEIYTARSRLFDSLGLDLKKAVFFEQVHGNKVASIGPEDSGRGISDYSSSIAGCDAGITVEPGVALCILTADCLPVFFWDRTAKAVGIAHAGWRGTYSGVVEKTITAMSEKHKSDPADIEVYIGPGIRSCCYQVGGEFRDMFPQDVLENRGSLTLDLAKANKRQLVNAGVREKNIFDTKICSCCSREFFFSYRRGDLQQRTLSLIVI